MALYVVYDGRYKTDPDRATILDTFNKQTDQEAIKEYKRCFHGQDSMLIKTKWINANAVQDGAIIADSGGN